MAVALGLFCGLANIANREFSEPTYSRQGQRQLAVLTDSLSIKPPSPMPKHGSGWRKLEQYAASNIQGDGFESLYNQYYEGKK